MFHMFNLNFKVAVGALLALSIFVGSRSFASGLNDEASNRVRLDSKIIISQTLGVSFVSISENNRLVEDLRINDLDRAELASEFQKRFVIELNPSQVDGARTVGELLNLVVSATNRHPVGM